MATNKRIAVCLPSWQEADSISRVASIVDNGCRLLPDGVDVTLVNADSDSDDGTSDAFLRTPTTCTKTIITVRERPAGKGRNLLAFFRYCSESDVDVAATIDSDITTVEPYWVSKLLEPILTDHCDYVTPLYTRSRYEGSTTNHFAYPLALAVYGADVRQPIGGEFAFGRNVIDHLLRQPVSDAVLGYGIDIFMSLHAVAGDLRIEQATLGRKIHKPSFPKIVGMFEQVATAAIEVLRQYGREARELKPLQGLSTIDLDPSYKHRGAAAELFEIMRERANTNLPVYFLWLGERCQKLERSIGSAQPALSGTEWARLLAGLVNHTWLYNDDSRTLARQLLPVFLLRAITFLELSVGRDAQEIDYEIVRQAHLVRSELQKLISRV